MACDINTLILWIIFSPIIVFWGWLIFEWTIMRFIRHYYPFPAPYFVTAIIDNPLRRNWVQKASTIADRMDLKPGMTLIEIGPGKGGYTEIIAKSIPDGTIYAVDISEKVCMKLTKRLKKRKITNIIPVLGDVLDLTYFTDASIDRIYSISAFPEIPDHVKALKEMARVLKPNGIIALSEIWIDPDFPRRTTERKWGLAAGLKIKAEFGHWYQYQLHFGKLE